MKYNIRGWLKEINDVNTLGTDLFAFKINYNDSDPNFQGTALYNGNISQTHWRTSSNNILKSYGYTYDGLNRLKNAKYYAGNDPANTDRYNENLQYDKNGNITKLNRRGSHNIFNELIDQLSYSYTGNQLQNVTDSTIANEAAGFIDGNIGTATNPDYSYDSFGNMIVDKNKKITTIKYNHLNLPLEIIFNNNSQTKINYTYNASGAKVSKDVRLGLNENSILQSSSTIYLGGYQYNNGVLQFFPHAEGYVKHNINPNTTASEFDYVYQYKDHLGNIRINYTFDPATSSLKVLEENHYYPFGLKHTESLNKRDIVFEKETQEIEAPWVKGISLLGDTKKGIIVPNSGYVFRFQEQEFQDELGLNWYSYKYRNYDPANGRFMSIDPLSEDYSYQSTYAFAENKVIDHRELEGLEGIHHTKVDDKGKKSHIVEKNVVFLRQNFTPIPQSATEDEKQNIIKKNISTANSEYKRINEVKEELKNSYGGVYENSVGEEVTFKINFKEIKTDNTNADKGNLVNGLSVHQLGYSEGIKGKEGTSPAAVFTTDSNTGGYSGLVTGAKVFGKTYGAPIGTWAHEFSHTLGLKDNGYIHGGILGNPIESLKVSEIDEILNISLKAN